MMMRKMELYSKEEERRRSRNAARRHHNVSDKKGRVADALILLLFVVICLLCITLHVQGNEMYGSGCEEAAYEELEKEYRDEVRGLLDRYGLDNSGMNLTRITQPDGMREYRLEIHHALIGHMSGTERQSLREGLEILGFPDEKSIVCVKLSF